MKKLSLVVLIMILCSGCYVMGNITRGNLNKIDIGMTKQEVVSIMGQPYTREVYQLPDGAVLQYLIYVTYYEVGHQETTPICLKDNRVIGWGRNFYEQQQQRYQLEIINR